MEIDLFLSLFFINPEKMYTDTAIPVSRRAGIVMDNVSTDFNLIPPIPYTKSISSKTIGSLYVYAHHELHQKYALLNSFQI